ncbi:MAG: phosphoribosylamine--glycine ligase, partial [Methylacidiphilales bacterium]|nr:phosphoribosylamine--glycine ligase [Candidatus Methylacidiphilales bacterium]
LHPLLDTPLIELLQAVREQRLGKLKVKFNANHAVTIVLAAAGYPGTPETGVPIEGLDADLASSEVFHAGTKLEGGQVLSNGGRVLSVTAWAPTLAAARELAYQRVAKIHFAGSQYRRDIAARLTLE